ncbi:restriction endonuclease [Lysobacter sp. HA35]
MKKVRVRRSDALTQVSWQQLESLLATHYRSQGYEVEHCGTGATGSRFDGGIDLKMRRGGEYVLVQAKHWNARQVPHNAVHELLGLMVNEGATGAVLVTSGEFTKAAVEAATRQGHVQLVDGEDLRTMLGGWTRVQAASPIAHDPDARWKRGAIDVSRHVGERLLSAAEDGLRQGAYVRRGRSAASTALTAIIVKFVMATVLMLIFVFGVTRAINGIIAGMAPRPAQQSVAAPASSPLQATAVGPSQRQPAPYEAEQAAGGPAPKPTAAELREQKRRADEAIKVIEGTTPAM